MFCSLTLFGDEPGDACLAEICSYPVERFPKHPRGKSGLTNPDVQNPLEPERNVVCPGIGPMHIPTW